MSRFIIMVSAVLANIVAPFRAMPLCFRACLVCIVALCAHPSFAGSCAVLDCDCASIPNKPFQDACNAHERLLSESCPDSKKDVRGYCGIHGSKANPVAITLDVTDVAPSNDVDASDRQVASLYWSIRQDVNFAGAALKKQEYEESIAILKIARRNLDSLFQTQLGVAQAWGVKEKPNRAKSAWKDYSDDTHSLAKHWGKLLKKSDSALSKVSKKADDDPAPLALLIDLRESIAELVALTYEQAGYAYAHAEKYGPAAKAWKEAAQVSSGQIAVLMEYGKKDLVNVYKNRSAARLNRASLYWLMSEEGDDEEEKAREAMEYASDQLLQKLLTTE